MAMSFKGIIALESDVTATLSASIENQRSGVLLVGLGVSARGAQEAVVAPKGSETISIKADKNSILEIKANFKGPTETGTLEVTVSGAVRNSEDVSDKTTWVYSVE